MNRQQKSRFSLFSKGVQKQRPKKLQMKPPGGQNEPQEVGPKPGAPQEAPKSAPRRTPKGPQKSDLTWWILGAVEDTPEQRAIRLRQSNLIGPGGYVALEDGGVVGWVRRGVAGSDHEESILAMGGRDTERFSDSRCSELSVRGFWQGWSGFMRN